MILLSILFKSLLLGMLVEMILYRSFASIIKFKVFYESMPMKGEGRRPWNFRCIYFFKRGKIYQTVPSLSIRSIKMYNELFDHFSYGGLYEHGSFLANSCINSDVLGKAKTKIKIFFTESLRRK